MGWQAISGKQKNSFTYDLKVITELFLVLEVAVFEVS